MDVRRLRPIHNLLPKRILSHHCGPAFVLAQQPHPQVGILQGTPQRLLHSLHAHGGVLHRHAHSARVRRRWRGRCSEHQLKRIRLGLSRLCPIFLYLTTHALAPFVRLAPLLLPRGRVVGGRHRRRWHHTRLAPGRARCRRCAARSTIGLGGRGRPTRGP